MLTERNQANSQAYERLTDDEHQVFTSRVFFALGGYPDYSAISVEENQGCGDFEVLIPEVPKLSPEDEARYRPLYERLVDPLKVAKDRERNKPPSADEMEQRSFQAFKKRVQQVCTCVSSLFV